MFLQVRSQLSSIRQHALPNKTYCEQTALNKLITQDMLYNCVIHNARISRSFFKVFKSCTVFNL